MGSSIGASVYTTSAVIASGQTASAVVDLRDFMLAGITMPAAFTGTSLTFQVATTSGGTYTTIEKEDGNPYSLTVEASKYYPVNVIHFIGGRFLKVVSGSAEGAQRTLTLHLIRRSVQPNEQVLFAAHNLSDVTSVSTSRDNLGVQRALVSQRIQHSDLTDAVSGEAQVINVGSALPTNAIIIAHEVQLDTLFTGGSASAVKLDLGGTDDKALFSLFNVHDTSAGAHGVGTWSPGYEHQTSHGKHCAGDFSGEQLVATFTPTGDSLLNLTAGDLTVRVWYLVIS